MKGYTLVELMIVIGVITTLSTIALVGIRGAAEREELVAASRQLVGDLISAQNKASSGKDKAGFGVEKSSAVTYRTYAYKYSYSSCAGDEIECADDYCDDCPSGLTDCSYCKEELSETSFKSPQIQISSPDSFSVYFFRPPNMGRALLSADPPLGGDSLEIVLEHTSLGFTKTIVLENTNAVQIYEE